MRAMIISVAATGLLAACGQPAEEPAGVEDRLYAEVSASTSATAVKSGSFSGRNGHTVTGGVQVMKDGDIYYIVLADDFDFDSAPDPRIGFGSAEAIDKATMSPRVDVKDGATVFQVPATVDPSGYDEVIIWCNQFDVALAIAPVE